MVGIRSFSARGQSCADHGCKLAAQEAQQEIAALDETVGELVMEIMDMLTAVSAFRKNKMEVSYLEVARTNI